MGQRDFHLSFTLILVGIEPSKVQGWNIVEVYKFTDYKNVNVQKHDRTIPYNVGIGLKNIS